MSRRRGLSAVASSAFLLLVLFVVLAGHQLFSRQVLRLGARAQLKDLARVQSQSAAEQLFHQVIRDVNVPGTPLYAFLRSELDGGWSQLDLSPYVATPFVEVVGRQGRGEGGRSLETRADLQAWGAELRAPSTLPGGEASEWEGLLRVWARVRVEGAEYGSEHGYAQNHEVRLTLVSPPRPFDQIGVFAGRLDGLTETGEVPGLREQAVRLHEELRVSLQDAVDQGPDGARDRLRAMLEGMKDPEVLGQGTAGLDVAEACVTGPYHPPEVFPLEALDPLPRIRERLAEAERAMAAGEQLGEGSSAEEFKRRGYEAVIAVRDLVEAFWMYRVMFTLRTHESAAYQRAVEPYLERLDGAYLRHRVSWAGTPEDPLLARWLAGEARLDGVVDLTAHGGALELTGGLRGRTLVLVGPGPVTLRDLRSDTGRNDGLVVASLGADVRVEGDCDVSILMLAAEGAGPESVGTLRIPAGRDRLELSGGLRADSSLRLPAPPFTRHHPRALSAFVLAVSPVPVFVEGGVR
jgi:hypothetical protein